MKIKSIKNTTSRKLTSISKICCIIALLYSAAYISTFFTAAPDMPSALAGVALCAEASVVLSCISIKKGYAIKENILYIILSAIAMIVSLVIFLQFN